MLRWGARAQRWAVRSRAILTSFNNSFRSTKGLFKTVRRLTKSMRWTTFGRSVRPISNWECIPSLTGRLRSHRWTLSSECCTEFRCSHIWNPTSKINWCYRRETPKVGERWLPRDWRYASCRDAHLQDSLPSKSP